jgi:hypothetical protein
MRNRRPYSKLRVIAAAAAALPLGCDTINYWEYNGVLAQLRQIPGIRIVSTGGHQDITFEDIHATIEIEGKGLLRFSNLERASFSRAASLQLKQIGDYHPSVVGYGHWGVVKTATNEPVKSIFFGGSLDVEPSSAFAKLFGRRFVTVQDAVLGFDELLAVVRAWPVCPQSAALSGADGSEYRYCANRSGHRTVRPEYPREWFPHYQNCCEVGGPPNSELQRTRPAQAMKPRR